MTKKHFLRVSKQKEWGPVSKVIEVSSFQESIEILTNKTDGLEKYDKVTIYSPEAQFKQLTRWVDSENKVWVFYEPIISDLKSMAYALGFEDIHPDSLKIGNKSYTNDSGFISFLDNMAMSGLVNEYYPNSDYVKELKIIKPLESKQITENGTSYKNNTQFKALYNRHKDKATEKMTKDILRSESIYTLEKDDKPELWYFREIKFVPEGKCLVEKYVRQFLGEKYKKKIATEVISKVSVDTYIDADLFFEEPNEQYIPLLNGIYDRKKRKLIPHSPEFRFRHNMPINYDPEAKCDKVITFLRDILKNESDVLLIQEIFGNLLLRNYKFAKALMLVAEGNNGKSKLLEVMRLFVGEENTEAVSLQQITNDQYVTSKLWGKLLNACGDISDAALKDTSIFKILLGNDKINANRKYKNHINFVNYAKLAFSANELPDTNDLTNGFFRRWLILEFPYTFYLPSLFEKLPPDQKEMAKVADPDIIEKIIDPQQMSGLFNWALEGLDRLEANRGFSASKSTEDLKTIWLRKSHSVYAFIMDEIQENYDSQIEKGDFRAAYNMYCRIHKLKAGTDSNIKYNLTRHLCCWGDTIRKGDTTVRVWKGIRFKHPQKYDVGVGDDLTSLDQFQI